MMCADCVIGGVHNANGDINEAVRSHESCKSKSCTCQHATGPKWIQGTLL